MKIGFRPRLFLILMLFALFPTALLTLMWVGTVTVGLPLVSASAAWDTLAASGEQALSAAREAPLTPDQAAAIAAYEQELSTSVTQARRFRYLATEAVSVVVVLAIAFALFLGLVASRVAGHLSRQLSRPLAELVDWTARIGRGEPLPTGAPRKGAPEFAVLRQRMRRLARQIEQGRRQAIEAERLAAFRETARQVAHELKNPLTPIQFAVDRLKREAPPSLADTVEVLAVESARLEDMARSFAQFGRLPEGPASDVDLGELVRYAARAAVPPDVHLDVEVEHGVPMVKGHYDALSRAVTNVLLNAVDACRDRAAVAGSDGESANGGRESVGAVRVQVSRAAANGREAVDVVISDSGGGIPPDQLQRIWDPYVTTKPGGTGLGLAIARQTVVAHGGEVQAHSAPGEGTRIRFTIPVGGTVAEPPPDVDVGTPEGETA